MNVVDLEPSLAGRVAQRLEVGILKPRVIQNLHGGTVARENDALMFRGLDHGRLPLSLSQAAPQGHGGGIFTGGRSHRSEGKNQ